MHIKLARNNGGSGTYRRYLERHHEEWL